MKRAIITVACLAACLALVANAQIPKTLNYQGVLTDEAGVAVPDGEYYITFSIYNQESGGSPIWSEDDTVQVTDGIFSVVLGTVEVLDLDFNEQYWMGMEVGGEAELEPRVELTATAYSLNSQAVTGEENVFPSSGYVGIGTIMPNRPLTLQGGPSDQIVMQVNGYESNYSSIYVNSVLGTSKPGYGYMRGGLKAHTFLEVDDSWLLRLGTTDALRIHPDGNVGVGLAFPNERLEVDGAVKLGGAAGTYEGTIQWTGTDFEGYDGSAWLSLTGGAGGNLPSGTTGQTLRHNGTDWEASSVLYNSGTRLGVGTTTPLAELEIVGDNIQNHFMLTATAGAGPAVYFNAVDADWVIYASNPGSSDGDEKLIFRDQSAATARMAIVPGGNVGVGTTTPVKMLDVNGSIRAIDTLIAPVAELGEWFNGGDLRILGSGVSGGALGIDAQAMAAGGQLRLWDEAGGVMHFLSPDSDGEGGQFSVMRDNLGRPGFTVDGNRNGTADTYVQINGTSTTIFDMSDSGDNSVVLPPDAISSSEILNEAGCASDIPALNTMDPAVVEVLGQRTITVPSSGFVLAIGTGQINISHTSGTTSAGEFGVSDDPGSFPANQSANIVLTDNLTSGGYQFPVTVHGLFEVAAAGSYTYYFLGREGAGSLEADQIQFTLLFIPTAYGTIEPTAMAMSGGSPVPRARGASADNAAERTESIAFNEARIEREIAEMRARLAELEKAVENK
ncbi:MAG: hypothetical protein JSV33_00380 [bacterium]|nr:MAG: hypothetical protein JSV33_00380 [bacterium]